MTSLSPRVLLIMILTSILVGCYKPPYNNFEPDNKTVRRTTVGLGVGAAVGAAIGTATGHTIPGLAIGGAAGTLYGLYKSSFPALINELKTQDIQYVQYGDTHTLIVPTDRYFMTNSAELNNICYAGLYNIIRVLDNFPRSTIYVAGFSDNVGSRKHKKALTESRAEAMLTYLWANNIHAQRLHAEGYGDLHPVSDNHLIHGSAQNRRIEIQWFNEQLAEAKPIMRFIGLTK